MSNDTDGVVEIEVQRSSEHHYTTLRIKEEAHFRETVLHISDKASRVIEQQLKEARETANHPFYFQKVLWSENDFSFNTTFT
jgi:hypothetical protein